MPGKKKTDFEDIDWQPLNEGEDDLIEDLVELREEDPKAIATVTVREVRRASDGRILVDSEDGQYYLLPKDFDFGGVRVATLTKDDSRLEKLYTWNKEIEAMLPDRASLVKAIRRSLYMAGAFERGDLNKNEVIKNALRYAFPYIIKEIEE